MSEREPLRVVHVGLGPLGRLIIKDLNERGLGEVVAAVDVARDLAGRDLSELVPEAAPGVAVRGRVEDLQPELDATCAVVTTRSSVADCAATFTELLRRGLSVVSTCEELLFPWLRHRALADELHRTALENDARLLGTGVNPGFLMDSLAVAATAVCSRVDAVRAWRVQDASPRRVPFQKKIGAGLDEDGFRRGIRDGWLQHVGLGESVHFTAHYLGIPVDRWEETIDPVPADRDLESGLGPIPAGRAAGVRQVARAFHGDRVVVELTFEAAIGRRDPYDRVLIEGEPRVDVTLPGGVHGDVATSAITLNALGSLAKAAPGLHTMATVPLVHA